MARSGGPTRSNAPCPSCSQVVTNEARLRPNHQVACVLHDVEEAVAEDRKRPRLARSEQPCSRDFLVSFRRKIEPHQMP